MEETLKIIYEKILAFHPDSQVVIVKELKNMVLANLANLIKSHEEESKSLSAMYNALKES